MTTTQKRLLAAAAIAGLVGGAVAQAKLTNNSQLQKMAGKQMSSCARSVNDGNSCSGKGGCGGSSKTNSTGKI